VWRLLGAGWSSISRACLRSWIISRLRVSVRPGLGGGLVRAEKLIRLSPFNLYSSFVLTSGLDCTNRLFISDRAHLVMGFHQIVDGLKEIELGGSSIGTTKKGIGPAYSSKASRSGLRVHHLYSPDFAEKFRKLVEGRFKRYGTFEYDTEAEIQKYLVSRRYRHEDGCVEVNGKLIRSTKKTPPVETRRASPPVHRRRPRLPAQSHPTEQTHPRRRRQRPHARPRLRDVPLCHLVGHLDRRGLYRVGYPTDYYQEGHRGHQGVYDEGWGWTFPYRTVERESGRR
jgi:hypothetical protein